MMDESDFFELMDRIIKEEENRLKKRNIRKRDPVKTIDVLLDEYNDYMTMYKMFGDKEYQDRANDILSELTASSQYVHNSR